MAVVTLNVSEQQSILPAGTYICRIEDAKTGVAKSGASKLTIRFVIQQGEFMGRSIFKDYPLSGRTSFLVRLINALGIPYDKVDNGNIRFDTDNFIGKTVLVTTSVQTYQPEGSAEVKEFVQVDSVTPITTDRPFV